MASYIVLARKHRPQTFDEVIGQEHITSLLKKAITANRIAHAYLFCGPRGIGKTSCARILAKSLNCEKGPTTTPCGTCPACTEIAGGGSFDVIEIDGASNRGIDEIRTVRENIKFAPSYGAYKIYIVDEVHMLTTEAFNALLKTLEEPPPHVKFIFATTEPNKVPATIISRCQRFDFKRISIKTIVDTLLAIATREKFTIEPDAVYAIAKAAQGSMRDALSVLDQLSALSDSTIQASDVCSMLGAIEYQLLFDVAGALGNKDCNAALQTLDTVIDKGKDVRQLLKDIIEHFRNLMVIKIGGKSLEKLIEYPAAIKEMLFTQAQSFTVKELLHTIEVLIEAQDVARITESIRLPLEVAFAKLTYMEEPAVAKISPVVQVPTAPRPVPVAAATAPASKLKSIRGHVDITGSVPEHTAPANEHVAASASAEKVLLNGAPQSGSSETLSGEEPNGESSLDETAVLDIARIRRAWDAMTYAVSKERMSLATFLQEGTPVTFTEGKIVIGFPKKCQFQKENLDQSRNIDIVNKKFSETLKATVHVAYVIDDSCEVKEEEPVVKLALDAFNGKVVNRWHEE